MHFRIGVTMPLVESLPPAWVPVDGKPSGYGTFFTQVAVGGQGDSSVWAIDNRKNVYVRKEISQNMPIGTNWEQVEGKLINVYFHGYLLWLISSGCFLFYFLHTNCI